MSDKPTAQERIDAARKRSADTASAQADAFLEQLATDLEAKADLEATHGFDRVRAISIQGVWKPGAGAPTLVCVVIPKGSDKLCQRFIETVNHAKEGSRERLKAQDDLASECWAYPVKGSESQKAALELAPLILSNAALQIVQASQGVAEETGKG